MDSFKDVGASQDEGHPWGFLSYKGYNMWGLHWGSPVLGKYYVFKVIISCRWSRLDCSHPFDVLSSEEMLSNWPWFMMLSSPEETN